MLVTLNEILTKAKAEGYAVPATNVDHDHNVRAAIEAAEEMNSPLILNMTPTANPDMEFFGPIAAEMARRSSQQICLNLDHGKTFEQCLLGVRSGFTNIMIDRSTLPFEENVKQVKEMVDICHALGLTVEGELGHVGMGDNYAVDGNQALTDVKEAAAFVEQTGVDALAVAIGTAHGAYKGVPKIRFELLHELRDAVPVPLVLHGGSGSGDENLARCAKEGINKLNLSNDLKRAAIENLVNRDLSGNAVYQLYPLLAEGFKNKIKHYIGICGCAGK
ncbi:class II fructose-bisphosphate aldolase [Anaerosacchariphilus sp. NSJ-68]|uniref:Class II fructose-bisphosphate aldolase n=2 Tax=Lachnospiraceae TaxID=186803 RepID=A0A923RNE7_9FIRM|nr:MULTISPECIES: class II fructose-bisphosphate aldolase [Lachnospiraceae]MBC5660416.1 class II fructose-bisphosphate aldolase [Anaerosacchariphilus hominis]MBC5697736.1 class II fructose-bisphosphate aldolase [Roseburia difficilis]